MTTLNLAFSVSHNYYAYHSLDTAFIVHWGLFSVPSYRTEWYWKSLMTGDSQIVPFHNSVYGCSGVQPEKFPCNGPKFTYVTHSLTQFVV